MCILVFFKRRDVGWIECFAHLKSYFLVQFYLWFTSKKIRPCGYIALDVVINETKKWSNLLELSFTSTHPNILSHAILSEPWFGYCVIRDFHNSRLIQQNKIYNKFIDLTRDWTHSTCLAVSNLNHYTTCRRFSVLVWGCNWILFMHAWFCSICLIHLIGRKSLHLKK